MDDTKTFSNQFRKLNELATAPLNSFINVIGIVISVDCFLKDIDTKNGPLKLRNFIISDLSDTEISVALWGNQAEKFSYLPGTILEFKSIKLTKYFHKFSLSIQRGTLFDVLTDCDMADKLDKFWSVHKMNIKSEQ